MCYRMLLLREPQPGFHYQYVFPVSSVYIPIKFSCTYLNAKYVTMCDPEESSRDCEIFLIMYYEDLEYIILSICLSMSVSISLFL